MSIRPRRSLLNPELQRPSALSSQARNEKALWLDKNENLDLSLMNLAGEILRSIEIIHIASYPEIGDLYRKLSQWVGVSPESLLISPGSDGAIRLAFETFVEHGESVIYTNPTFAMYRVYCQMFGADECVIDYVPTETGPYLDPNRVIKMLRQKRPKLFCLPNPDSPTGTVMSNKALKEILTTCEETGTVFLLDEAYHPFYDWTGVQWTQQSRNLIVARTFAKAWGAAGLRIGYLVAHPETIILFHKMRPMYEVGTVSIEFMNKMLDHIDAMETSVARINEGKMYFLGEMSLLGFKVLPTAGNFVHVCFGEKGALIAKSLADKVLYKHSFEHPSLAGFSRFSIAPKEEMERVVSLIRRAIE